MNFMDDVGQTLLNWAAAFGTYEMVGTGILVLLKQYSHHFSSFPLPPLSLPSPSPLPPLSYRWSISWSMALMSIEVSSRPLFTMLPALVGPIL